MSLHIEAETNGRHFADIFKCIFLNENVSISINISLKFVPEGRINNIRALVQIMAWRRLGDKPLSELMMVSLLTHICVTRPQWVKPWWPRMLFTDHYTVETLYNTIYYSKYFIELNFDKSTQYVALWTHKRHPIPRPFGRAMECLLWVLQQKLTVL